MAFGFRRKKTTEIEQPARPAPPVSILLSGGGRACLTALLPALPEYSEILSRETVAEENIPQTLTIRTPDGGPAGKYVLHIDSEDFDFSALKDLLYFLNGAEEEAVFFGKKDFAEGEESLLPRLLSRETELPRGTGCAFKRDLYGRMPPAEGLAPEYRETFAPLLFAENAAFAPYPIRTEKSGPEEETRDRTEDFFALAEYFNDAKGKLSPERYSFAFRYVCRQAVSRYAELGAEGDRDALAAFDGRLKGCNMALRVAAGENSPLGFVEKLAKRNFSVPFYLRTYLKLYLKRN